MDTNTNNNESIIRAIDNTGVRMFLYYPQTKSLGIPENTCEAYQCSPVYENMPDSFADDFVYPDDYDNFKSMYYEIDRGAATASAIFHSKDLKFCHHVTLTTVSWDADGKPESALGIIENITDDMKTAALLQNLEEELNQKALEDLEKQKTVSRVVSAIGNQYYAIYHIDLSDDSFYCFRDNNNDVNETVGQRGVYSKKWNDYVTHFIQEEFREDMYAFGDYSSLAQRLHYVDSISQNYQRINIGWLKAQFIVAQRDENGKAVEIVLAVYDINDEIKIDQQRKEAQFEAEHDPLTKLYNRKAFERIVTNEEFAQNKIGFMLIDIDNFKALNDCHGHDLGDQVLISVAEKLTQVFRREDKIFRLGGDEIAILLYNCDEKSWKIICDKLGNVHSKLIVEYSDGVAVTLSSGVCFSQTGYRKELYLLADEALYSTKQNGRAGCTLINEEHEILENWSDDAVPFHTKHVLEYTTSGMFRMEIPKDSQKSRRIVCGDAVKAVFGADSDATPEDCYQIWEKGVLPEYYLTVHEAMETMVRKGHAECTYLWKHPQWGEIYVRSNAFGEVKDGVIILTGIHHVLKDTNLVEKKDDQELINAAMSDMYFGVFYLDILRDTFATIKTSQGEHTYKMGEKKLTEQMDEFITYLVAQSDRKGMREFTNPDTMQDRIGNESYISYKYRSINLEDWTQMRLIPVKYDINGKLTHVLAVVLVLDHFEEEEKNYDKKSLTSLYNNVPAGIVMYEWNGKQLKTIHISEYYAREYGYTLNSEEGENKGGPDFKRVHPDDLEGYQKAIQKALASTDKFQYIYRVWNQTQNAYLWVKVDAIAKAQTNGNSLVYAVYTDITGQQLAEQRLKKSNMAILSALEATEQFLYEYDPVKHTSTCYSGSDYGYHLGQIIYNYPECFRSTDFMHPDDVKQFIDTVHEIDQGAETAHCEIRVFKEKEEHWHSCTFHSFFDAEKGYRIAILTVVDITLNKDILQNYEERFHSLLTMEQDVFSICEINLTHNTFKMLRQEDMMNPYIDETKSFETVMMNVVPNIVGKEAQNKYRELFCVGNLLQQMENGNTHVEYDYLLKITEDHYEWITAVVDMIVNPMSHEVTGVSHSKSSQNKHMSEELLGNALRQDYVLAAIIVKDTDEFYMYNPQNGKFSECMKNFWEQALFTPAIKCSKAEMNYMKNTFKKNNILHYLETHKEFRYAFGNMDGPYASRREMHVCYADQQKTMLLATVRNITDAAVMEKWKHDSEHDRLTGLLNREAVFRKCRSLLEEHPEEQFVMVHGDMRHFHLYNTFFGDKAGDQLLCKMADLISSMESDYDYGAYGRIESDVFCAFFPIAQGHFERNVHNFYRELKKVRKDFLLVPAIGAYWVTDSQMSVEEMFSRATIAAKSGKINLFGLISQYDEEMDRELKETQMVTNEMNKAITEEEFQVYLQPKYALRSEKIVGAEALARWIHPKRGLISPGLFIPVIEKNGSIAELDRYMWEHVCQILRRWMDEGKPLYPVSVNISRVSMYNRETVSVLINLVKKYRLDPKYLELELTETAYMDDPEDLKRMLKELQEFGFKILIDDFGSGYSSLNTLRDLPVDVLKLDMKFLTEIENGSRGLAVLSSVVRMSKLLNLPIVAEGVEEKQQADYLRSIGCEYVQGFLYARPMPIAEYEKLLVESEILEADEVFDNENTDSAALADVVVEDPCMPLGVLEYDEEHFAYLRTNKKFLQEFDLVENLKPASKVFRDHLDDRNYNTLLQAFAVCSEKMKDTFCTLKWIADDGKIRTYHGYVNYRGNLGSYADLMVTFMNVTEIERVGFEE